MTYKLDSTAVSAVVPEIAMLRINCNDTPLTTSSVILFEDNISNVTFNGISSDLTVTNAGLTLGVGHWQLQAFLGTDNDDDMDNNVKDLWYEGGVGARICVKGPKTLNLKLTEANGNPPYVVDGVAQWKVEARMLVWRL